jgi:hypothetical protein
VGKTAGTVSTADNSCGALALRNYSVIAWTEEKAFRLGIRCAIRAEFRKRFASYRQSFLIQSLTQRIEPGFPDLKNPVNLACSAQPLGRRRHPDL